MINGQGSRLAVVTGAASGMGEATASLLHGTGHRLLMCDINAERLANTAARLGGDAVPATLSGDIAEPGFGGRLTEALEGCRVDAFVHCAGLSPTMADGARILEVNLAATIRLVEAIRPAIADGGAAVLFASSAAYQIGEHFDEALAAVRTADEVAGLLPSCRDNPGIAYSIAKRGVMLLARREAAAFGRAGARIASISPGIIDTPMQRQEIETHEIVREMIARSALRRPARAKEVAAVAGFLCSPAASFVTGIDVLVDGGAIAAMG